MNGPFTLPVHADPGLSTECYHQLRLSVLLSSPSARPWMYSHFVNLHAEYSKSEYFPTLTFEDHLDIYKTALQEDSLPVLLESDVDWHNQIKACLQQGDYVLIYLNWRHIPSSSFYNKQSVLHEAVIFGYDDVAGCFHALGYEVGGSMYGTTQIPYQTLREVFRRHLAEDAFRQKWYVYYGFPLARLRIKHEFLSQLDYRRLYLTYDRGKVFSEGEGNSLYALGYPVLKAMASYFSQVLSGRSLPKEEFPYWNTMVTKLIQHSRIAQARWRFLGGLYSDKNLERILHYYQLSYRGLLGIRIASLKYQRTGDQQHLTAIHRQFVGNFEQEFRAASLVSEYLIQLKPNCR